MLSILSCNKSKQIIHSSTQILILNKALRHTAVNAQNHSFIRFPSSQQSLTHLDSHVTSNLGRMEAIASKHLMQFLCMWLNKSRAYTYNGLTQTSDAKR